MPEVQRVAEKLIANLSERVILETLLSAYLPAQYGAVREGNLAARPLELILNASKASLKPYAETCSGSCERVLAGR